MEKPFTGLTACVKIGSGSSKQVLAYISGCSLTLEKDIIEILAFGMTFKEKVPAIKDWSLSCNGTVALADGGTQETLYAAFDSGEPMTVSIYLDDNTYFEGTGYVKNFNIDASPDDKINLTSEIAGSGATTLTLPVDTTRVSKPVAYPQSGTIPSGTSVTLATNTPGASIYYTMDGSTPTSASTAYTGPINITTDKTIKVIATKSQMQDSEVLVVDYTVSA